MPAEKDAPETRSLVRAHVRIHGRVQRVFFRAETEREARSLGLAGWVRNAGEDVEAAFEGSREAVERMIEWCHEGPPRAAVETVEVDWEAPQGARDFVVKSSA
ncbi:MAG: acylphosphatase [Coriobacteriia bacterium]